MFASVRSGDQDHWLPVPDRKAIVNAATHRVRGIVGKNYVVVTNQQALDWGRQCCAAAFPTTSPAEWQVYAADAPNTASYCCIDLVHNSGAVDFSFVPAKLRPEIFGPFVRVTNSYNLLRALMFDIGFHRKVCRNGLIVPQRIVQFRFSHQRKHLRDIRFDVHNKQLTALTNDFKESVSQLSNCGVPEELFRGFVRGVLGIQTPPNPSGLKREAVAAWAALDQELAARSAGYLSELGGNAYAVLNTATDVASRPPDNVWIRRDRHSMQRRTGVWLQRLTEDCRRPDFSVRQHVERLFQMNRFDSARDEPHVRAAATSA